MSKAEEILKKNGLSNTSARKQILEFFLKSNKPLSINDFKKRAAFKNFNESSIYRNLSKLETFGIIQKIPSAGEFQSYELLQTGHHHHHISCIKCKKIQCLHMCGLEKIMKDMASSVKFNLLGHSIELTGLCSACAKL